MCISFPRSWVAIDWLRLSRNVLVVLYTPSNISGASASTEERQMTAPLGLSVIPVAVTTTPTSCLWVISKEFVVHAWSNTLVADQTLSRCLPPSQT